MAAPTARFGFLYLLAASGGAGADDAPAGRVTLRAESPVVALSGVSPGRYSVDLPALEYAFEVAAECAGDAVPVSLSINVADSRARLSAEELAAPGGQRLMLRVPAEQTAPLALEGFCAASTGDEPAAREVPGAAFAPGAPEAPPRQLEVPNALSAQVSLVCGDGERRSMTWVSQPLGVVLSCALPGRPASDDAAAPAVP